MIMRLLIICLICVSASLNIVGQQKASHEESQYVIVPPDQAMLVIVNQSNCPLVFEDPKILMNMKGVWVKSFKLRNRGTKPIRGYTVAAVGTDEWSWTASDSKHLIMPGESGPMREEDKNEIVPLSDELRQKLKLHGPLKGIVALMVVQIEYADGSILKDAAYKTQQEFFWRLYEEMSPNK